MTELIKYLQLILTYMPVTMPPSYFTRQYNNRLVYKKTTASPLVKYSCFCLFKLLDYKITINSRLEPIYSFLNTYIFCQNKMGTLF